MVEKGFNNVFNFGIALASFCVIGWIWQTGGCQVSREFMSEAEEVEKSYEKEPADGLPAWADEADLNGDGNLTEFERIAYEEEHPRKKVQQRAPRASKDIPRNRYAP